MLKLKIPLGTYRMVEQPDILSNHDVSQRAWQSLIIGIDKGRNKEKRIPLTAKPQRPGEECGGSQEGCSKPIVSSRILKRRGGPFYLKESRLREYYRIQSKLWLRFTSRYSKDSFPHVRSMMYRTLNNCMRADVVITCILNR